MPDPAPRADRRRWPLAAPPRDREEFARRVRQSVLDVVRRQAELGLDVLDDGEYSKSTFAAYSRTRLGGFEPFLRRYLFECLTIGYPEAPMEQEVIALTARICGSQTQI